MINYRLICKILGLLLIIESLLFIAGIGVSLYYHDGMVPDFVKSALITLFAGAVFLSVGLKAENSISKKDGCLIVTLTWILFTIFGMLPYYFSGRFESLANCVFETMSGFTTTGASILDNIEEMPRSILFWRSFTHWIGGFGIVFFTLAFLPIFGIGGMQLFAAETAGITHEKIHPKVRETSKKLWLIYLFLTIAAIIILYLQDMSLFDSVCHSMSTIATGGFSTKQDSIKYYDSPGIEYTIAIFMILSSINFSLYYLGFFKKKAKEVLHNTELRYFLVTLSYTVLVIAGILYVHQDISMEEAFRKSLFQVASVQSTTGLATDDFTYWPPLTWILILFVMIIGSCAGSTSGGMKCVRLSVIIKVIKKEFIRMLHPNAVSAIKINDHVIKNEVVTSATSFIFIYLIIVFIGWGFFINYGIQPLDAIYLSASCLGNVGLAIGEYGASFSWNHLPEACKWFASLLMLIGRLEIFTVAILFTSYFWKKH